MAEVLESVCVFPRKLDSDGGEQDPDMVFY